MVPLKSPPAQSTTTPPWFGCKNPNPDLNDRARPARFSVPAHKPGQYFTLGMGQWEPRASGCQDERPKPGDETTYSPSVFAELLGSRRSRIFARPCERRLVGVLHRSRAAIDQGPPALTPRLFTLEMGSRFSWARKSRRTLHAGSGQPGGHVLFLATGTGEGAAQLHVVGIVRRGHTGKICPACCVRYRRDWAIWLSRRVDAPSPQLYLPQLDDPQRPSIFSRKCIFKTSSRAVSFEERLSQQLNPAATHVYLCGNPKMIACEHRQGAGAKVYPPDKGVIEILENRGFRLDQPSVKMKKYHVEEYW